MKITCNFLCNVTLCIVVKYIPTIRRYLPVTFSGQGAFFYSDNGCCTFLLIPQQNSKEIVYRKSGFEHATLFIRGQSLYCYRIAFYKYSDLKYRNSLMETFYLKMYTSFVRGFSYFRIQFIRVCVRPACKPNSFCCPTI